MHVLTHALKTVLRQAKRPPPLRTHLALVCPSALQAAPAARKQQAPTTAGAQQAVVQGGAAGPLPEPVLQQLADAPVRITRAKMRALASGASAAEVVKPTRRSSSGPGGGAGGGRRASAATAAMAATPMPEQVAQPQPAGPLRSPLPDIDKADHANHLAETLYVNDIYAYFRRVEGRFRVPHDYMTQQVCAWYTAMQVCTPYGRQLRGSTLLLPPPPHTTICSWPSPQLTPPTSTPWLLQQPDINEKMRAILIDWLVEVHLKFKVRCRPRTHRPCSSTGLWRVAWSVGGMEG